MFEKYKSAEKLKATTILMLGCALGAGFFARDLFAIAVILAGVGALGFWKWNKALEELL